MGVGHLVGIRPLAARFLDLGTADSLGLNKSIDPDGEGQSVDSAASSRTGVATAEIRRQSPPINEKPEFRAKRKTELQVLIDKLIILIMIYKYI